MDLTAGSFAFRERPREPRRPRADANDLTIMDGRDEPWRQPACGRVVDADSFEGADRLTEVRDARFVIARTSPSDAPWPPPCALCMTRQMFSAIESVAMKIMSVAKPRARASRA